MDSPYQPPSAFTKMSDVSDSGSTLHWRDGIAWGYPVLLIVLMHAVWGMACIQLGHPPEPWVDWPEKMGPLIDGPYTIAQRLMLISPAAALCGLCFQLFAPRRKWWLRLPSAAALLILWTLIAQYWHEDPLQVRFWFWD